MWCGSKETGCGVFCENNGENNVGREQTKTIEIFKATGVMRFFIKTERKGQMNFMGYINSRGGTEKLAICVETTRCVNKGSQILNAYRNHPPPFFLSPLVPKRWLNGGVFFMHQLNGLLGNLIQIKKHLPCLFYYF